MRGRTFLLASVIVLWLIAPARAGLIVTIGGSSIARGGTGTVDVLIRSDAGDPLNSFGFEFLITTSGPTRLEFVNPQPDLQLTDPSYVFLGDSLANNVPLMVGAVGSTFAPNDTFIGGDATDSGQDVSVTTTDRLLARLQVTAATSLTPVMGDSFTISLVTRTPVSNTFFSINSGAVAFSSEPGTVTIQSVTAVPEPSSLTLLGTILGGFFLISSARLCRKYER